MVFSVIQAGIYRGLKKSAIALTGQPATINEYNPLASSPRRSHLFDVGDRTIATGALNQAILYLYNLCKPRFRNLLST